MASTISMRSAGINGITQTARAADNGAVGLEAEPYGSECIADQGADDHADQLDPVLFAVVNHKSGNDCHRDKAYYVTAGWSGELGNAAGKTGKDRKSGKASNK